MSTEAFDKLGSYVKDAVLLLSSLQSENRILKEEIEQLQKSLEEIKGENSYKGKLIKQFKNDRLKIRTRVEQIMEKVNSLEEAS
ncbi:MAG: cell division protein ZapB [Acidobacteriota bacterium]